MDDRPAQDVAAAGQGKERSCSTISKRRSRRARRRPAAAGRIRSRRAERRLKLPQFDALLVRSAA